MEQFDEIRICLNGYDQAPLFLKHDKIKVVIPTENYTDNGKFMFLHLAEPDELYCTLDDDILYPADYRQTLEEAIKIYPDSVLTFHGRILKGKFEKYYKAPHKVYRCFGNVKYDFKVDVCGTGVSAFIPFEGAESVTTSKLKKMSDVIFSLHCAFKQKKIICLKHDIGWLKNIDNDQSIFEEMSDNDFRQAILCQKIFDLNN